MTGAADEGPFYEGQNAFARGFGRTACPYAEPLRVRRQWLDGWQEAKRYDDVRRIIEAACASGPVEPCAHRGAMAAMRQRQTDA